MIGKTAKLDNMLHRKHTKDHILIMDNVFIKLLKKKVNFTDTFSAWGKEDNFNSEVKFW